MEFVTPKIELYRTRTFSEKISDTFAFIRESWRPILKYFTYFMLPVSIVLAFFMDGMMSQYIRSMMGLIDGSMMDTSALYSFALMTFGLFIVSVVGTMLLIALVYAFFRLYDLFGEQRLRQLTMDVLKKEMRRLMLRTLILMTSAIALGLLIGLLIGGVVILLFTVASFLVLPFLPLLYIGLLVVLLPLTLVTPIYLLEDGIDLLEAYQKAWRFGFQTWGGLFAVVFVLGLIGALFQSFTSLPWTIAAVFKTMFTLQGETGGFVDSAAYSFMQYLFCIVQCYFSFLAYMLIFVGVTIHYGHASDKIDGTGVSISIDNFDELDNF